MSVVRARLGRLAPLVVVALLAGAALRLLYPSVFSFMDDEKWTFDHVEDARSGGPWATLGMPSSRGVKNAPMSIWVFVVLGVLGRVATPEGLTRAVAVLAIVANVVGVVLFTSLVSEEDERRSWIWAFVLASTNPILVFLERKIWAQSVLPVLDVALLAAWMKRDTRAGAFTWGLVAALVGQIHMAGFFFAPALVAFTFFLSKHKKARWWWWLGGSALGALPAIPWVLYLIRERPPPNPSPWWLRFRLEFYEYFFSDPSALCTPYVVGGDALALLGWPVVLGKPTYLVALACVALAVASLAIAWRCLEHAWRRRHDVRGLLLGDRSDTGILLAAVLLGMGVLMTVPSIAIHRHYMMAIFPLPYVWTARAALRKAGGERWLATLFAGGLVVSLGILGYVRDNDGADEFGKSWGAQVRDGTTPAEAKAFHHPEAR